MQRIKPSSCHFDIGGKPFLGKKIKIVINFSNWHILFSPQVFALKFFLGVLTTLEMQEKLVLDPQTSTN